MHAPEQRTKYLMEALQVSSLKVLQRVSYSSGVGPETYTGVLPKMQIETESLTAE